MITYSRSSHLSSVMSVNIYKNLSIFSHVDLGLDLTCVSEAIKGVVNCQNSRDKGPPDGNSARG